MSGQILHFQRMDDAPNRIRELRMAKGWSIQRLGDAINMSKMNVSQIERGTVILNVHHMRLLSRALGCSADELLSRHDNPNRLSEAERDLVDRLRAASEDDRTRLFQIAEAILPDATNGEDDSAAA